jgi:cytochrome c-type biogenesis protein
MAANSGSAFSGVLLLVTYSLGLGIPFIVSALVLDKLRGAFGFIKRHYRVINMVCGIFLIAVGVLMATGLFDKFMALFI